MSQKKTKWISVEKELPKSYEKVLTFNSFGTIDFDIYRAIGGWQLCECVTHWMPLPTPPKIKSNKSRYERLVEEHRCVRCREPLPEGYKMRMCQECYTVNKSKWDARIEKLKKEGKCIICQHPLPKHNGYMTCRDCRVKRSQGYYKKKESKNDR